MPISSSTIAGVGVQRDGRRWILERHLDHLGIEYTRHWLAGASDDLDAALASYAAQLLGGIRDAEISRNIASVMANGSQAVTSTAYSTAAQNFSALRDAYQTATRVEAIMIGDFLGSLTDVQLRAAFNTTQTQVDNLRANKLGLATSAANGIRATTGA